MVNFNESQIKELRKGKIVIAKRLNEGKTCFV